VVSPAIVGSPNPQALKGAKAQESVPLPVNMEFTGETLSNSWC